MSDQPAAPGATAGRAADVASGRPHPEPGLIGGRYQLERPIGSGGMGLVWQATDELLGRTVAVKELVVERDDRFDEARQRVMREARLAARMQHPHAVSVFDVVLHDDRPWLIMEFLPSRSLAEVLAERGRLPPGEVADIGSQVADGLSAAHAAGIVHRDIKPGNVLITPDGTVKITDFGVSRAVDEVQITSTGVIAGTPAFLAPEVARGQSPTAAADLFALGATLYAAVEGQPPFGQTDNALALLHKVANGELTPPSVAGPLTATLMGLLQVPADDRPTAAEARDRLRAVAERAQPAQASKGKPSEHEAREERLARFRRTSRRGRRNGPALAAALAMLLALAGGVATVFALGTASGSPPAQPAEPTNQAPAAAPPAPAQPAPSPESAPTAAAPPTAEPQSPPAAASKEAFVSDYYALLPGDLDAAWARLGPTARSQAGGYEGFRRFYGEMTEVSIVDGPRSAGPDTVQATVGFAPRSRAATNEPYSFTVVRAPDGGFQIASSSRA